MSKNEIYISFIKDELRKGNASFTSVFELNLTKFNLSRPTFSKYWKLANEAYKQEFSEVETAKVNERTQIELNTLRSDILSKDEALKVLSDIVVNDEQKPNDRISAVNQMAKMQGWEAKKEIEQTNIIQNPLWNVADAKRK
jgi:hypothetical protein